MWKWFRILAGPRRSWEHRLRYWFNFHSLATNLNFLSWHPSTFVGVCHTTLCPIISISTSPKNSTFSVSDWKDDLPKVKLNRLITGHQEVWIWYMCLDMINNPGAWWVTAVLISIHLKVANFCSYTKGPVGDYFHLESLDMLWGFCSRSSMQLLPFGVAGHTSAMELLLNSHFIQYVIISIWSRWTHLVASAIELLFTIISIRSH